MARLHVLEDRLLVIKALAVSSGVLLERRALVWAQAVPGLASMGVSRKQALAGVLANKKESRASAGRRRQWGPSSTGGARSSRSQGRHLGNTAVPTWRTIASILIEFSLVSCTLYSLDGRAGRTDKKRRVKRGTEKHGFPEWHTTERAGCRRASKSTQIVLTALTAATTAENSRRQRARARAVTAGASFAYPAAAAGFGPLRPPQTWCPAV